MAWSRLAAAAVSAAAVVVASPAVARATDSGTDRFHVEAREGTLGNGMKVLVVERPAVPTVACVIKFRVGSVDEHPGVTGIAHILEHMLFKGTDVLGTKDYAAEKPLLDRTEELWQEIVRARAALPLEISRHTEVYDAICSVAHRLAVKEATPAERRDAKIEAEIEALRVEAAPLRAMGPEVARIFDLESEFCRVQEEADRFVVDDEDWGILDNNGAWGLNASTGNDSTQYFYSLPSNRLELWALIESGRMRNPVLRQFYKERDVIMEERRMRTDDSPFGRLIEVTNALAFDAHPYHWPVIGWAADIRNTSRTATERFFRKYYAPNRAIACVVGDVKFEKVMALLDRYFGDIPRQEDPDPVHTVEPVQKGEKRAVVGFKNLRVPLVSVSYHRPAIGHPDFYVLDVLIGILSGGNSSRLPRHVFWRDHVGQVQARNGDSLYPDLFTFIGQPMPGKTPADLEAAIEKEVRALQETPVSDAELRRVRTQNYASMVRGVQDNMGLAQTLSSYERLHRWDYINTYAERINAVTAEDILRVAKKYFRPENRTVVHLVPERAAE